MLLATAAAIAVGFTACGGGGGSSEDAQAVLEDATLKGVESGNLDLKLGVKAGDQGNFDVSLSGPFQSNGKESLPLLDMAVKVNGKAEGQSIDFAGGLTLLADRAFIEYENEEYEVDPTTFGFVRSSFEQGLEEGGQESAGESTECQNAAKGLDPASFVENVESEGGADVQGTETTKVSGDLNVEKTIDELIKLAESPACSSAFDAAGGALPFDQLKEQKSELVDAIKKAHADIYVGDDNIIRKLVAELEITAEGETVNVDVELSLGEVNEEQDITAPSGSKPLEDLFQQLGVNPLELLEAGGSGGLGGLLEGLQGGSGGLEGEGGEIELPEELELPEDSSKYLECLQEVETPTDLQKCANLAE